MCLTFHLSSGAYYQGELQNVDHVGEQKIKCGIKTLKVTDIRFLSFIYLFELYFMLTNLQNVNIKIW